MSKIQVTVTESSPERELTHNINIPDSPTKTGMSARALEMWRDLPETMKQDPTLAPFKADFERQIAEPIPGTSSGGILRLTPTFPNIPHTVSFSSSDCTPSPASRLSPPFGRIIAPHTSPGLRRPSRLTQYTSLSIGTPHSLGASEEDIAEASSAADRSTEEANTPLWKAWGKIGILLCMWMLFTVVLMMKSERVTAEMHQISISEGQAKIFPIKNGPSRDEVCVLLTAAFLPKVYANLSTRSINVWLEQVFEPPVGVRHVSEDQLAQVVSDTWSIPLVTEDMLEKVPEVQQKNVFRLLQFERGKNEGKLRIRMETNLNATFPIAVGYDLSPIDQTDGIVYAILILAGLYSLIIFEIAPRTLAALMASTMSVATLAALNERPTMAELITWIDVETLLLLFSMMVIVAILSETGFFDYLAVVAFRVTAGQVWPLINTLCIFTAFLSAFLDNVTVALLMTPVSIRLCEVMGLNPVPILMFIIMFANIGGTATAVGDPPNVIIASSKEIRLAGIDFTTYTIHMTIGVVLVMVVVHIQLRIIYRNISDLRVPEPQQLTELRREISVWQRAAASLSSYSKDEDLVRETLMKKVRRLLGELRIKMNSGSVVDDTYKTTLEELQKKYPIKNKWLLLQCVLTLLFVITVFFVHSLAGMSLSLGWTALLGAMLLLIIAGIQDIESTLARVEWSTLLFFACLFVLMEALSRLGLIAWIGQQTERLILLAPTDGPRLGVAIILILWVSAIASAFVDNIPLTTMMIKVVISLCNSSEVNLPLQPLVWALAFGACLGGNGTLIGASANVVCAGVAEQHGYRFTFTQFFRVGFPVMVVSVATAMCYLIVAHVLLDWN